MLCIPPDMAPAVGDTIERGKAVHLPNGVLASLLSLMAADTLDIIEHDVLTAASARLIQKAARR
jgi:hypothetical protein